MELRLIQWNIRIGSDAESIGRLIFNSIHGPTIVHLQEVSTNSYSTLSSALQPDSQTFSLLHRVPGKHEGRNRQMGVATFVFGGELHHDSLVARSLFPERTLVTEILIEGVTIKCLNFHSLTGVDYKGAKSSNFASLADFISEAKLDFFSCDANEPKTDVLSDEQVEFFDNRDKGRCAAMIFGPSPVHNLHDALKTHLRSLGAIDTGPPLAVSHIVAGKPRRYGHIYHSSQWGVSRISYDYDGAIAATSDHAIVIGDFSRKAQGRFA